MMKRLFRRLGARAYDLLDRVSRAMDLFRVRHTRSLHLIPNAANRRGGKVAYGEWCQVIGVFQALIGVYRPRTDRLRILDAGCGTGLLAIAADPFLGERSIYVGLDVSARDVAFCRRHYRAPRFRFEHLDASNPHYTPTAGQPYAAWPFTDSSFDVVTALSLWTHLNQAQAIFYFHELDRVLAPGGRAIITALLIDEYYRPSGRPSRYHPQNPRRLPLDVPCSPSGQWFKPAGTAVPETRVALTPRGVELMLEGTKLRPIATYPGLWKDVPGLYYQDVLVFERH